MRAIFSSLMALGLLINVANADIFTNRKCDDPIKIKALKTYYKDYLYYYPYEKECPPQCRIDKGTFKLHADNVGKRIFKTLAPEDAYICRNVATGGAGTGPGSEYFMVRIDGKIYIYDRQYEFDDYGNDTHTIEFVKKHGVLLN